nr:hypothetical protein [Tanacetum cinerariifolium]
LPSVGGFRKRLATGPRPYYYIRDVASISMGLVLVRLFVWLDPEPIVMIRPRPRGLVCLLYVIKSLQSSMPLPADCVLRAVIVTRLSKTLSKDPPPKLSQYDTQAHDFLRTHIAPFWKFPEPFLCWVGISRYYKLDENCYLTFWDGNEGEYTLLYVPDLIVLRLYLIIFFYYVAKMDLFSFIRHSDPTKVLIGERNVAEGEVKLLMLIEGRVFLLVPLASPASRGSNDSIDKVFDDGNDVELEHPTKRDDDVLAETITKDISEKLREDYHAATSNIDVKSLAAIRDLILEGSRVPSEVTEPRVVASVTPTPDHGEDGPIDFMSRLNLRTRPLAMKYVVSSDDSHHSCLRSEVNSFARSPVADALIMTVVVTTNIAADVFVVSISKGRVESKNLENFKDSVSAGRANANVASSSKLNEPATSSDSFYASQDLDFKTLHHIYVSKWKVTNDSVLDDPAARQMCLGVEVRMRTEHTLEQKGKLEDKYAEQASLLSEKDDEIADLKSLLSLKEAEFAEAIRFHGQLSVVEAADAAKGNELKGLKEKNLEIEEEKNVLCAKVTTLESVTAAKETELVSFSSQVAKLTSNMSSFQLSHDELGSMVASLESERDSLADQRSSLESAFKLFKGRMETMQDEQAMVLVHRIAELDAQLLEMVAHLEEEFYPRFLTTISGRRWILTHGLKLVVLKCLQSFEYLCALGETIGYVINKGMQDGLKARIGYGKAGRDLSVIEAYDPSAEAKYVDALNALCTVDFFLLSVLKFKKDACMANLMDSLRLEGPLAEIPEAEELQPSLEQLKLPIHRMEDDIVLGETSLSFSLQVVHSRVQRSLIGEASTSAIHATAEPITSLSTTFASPGVVPPLFYPNIKSWMRNNMMKTLLP